jgi:uncharacterized protein (DUF342 family)
MELNVRKERFAFTGLNYRNWGQKDMPNTKRFPKYFTAASKETALAAAAEFFQCQKDQIFAEVKREGNDVLPWTLLTYCLEGKDLSAIENINGSFKLYYENDGVYLEIYPNRGAGTKLDRETITAYVNRKTIRLLNIPEMLVILDAGEGRAQIGPVQSEIILGEDVEVDLGENDMEGLIKFLPPDKGGSQIALHEVKDRIRKRGIVFGLDEQALAQALSEKNYGKSYVVAKGLEPVNGTDGYLQFHVNIQARSYAPKESGQGRIDYKTLDQFEPVKEGQLLVTRHPATPGVLGRTVRGNELKPHSGKEAVLPRSKNALMNETKSALYAKASGMVEFVNNVLTVSNVYTVKGDCDLSVGNIDFDGSVVIGGNVISGLVIKATGSVTISGVVEGSEIIAGGNIELKTGMQGMDKGRLVAGGTITAQFIERSSVTAGVDVLSDSVIHCTVEAGRSLIMKGRRGNLMGGNIRVTSEVIAKVIGSTMHMQTAIEVGLVPQKRTRLIFLTGERQRIQEELEKLNKLELYLSRGGANMTKENADKILRSAKESKYQNAQLLEEYTEEINRLEYESNNATGGRVHVLDTAYPGTRITIASGTYRVIEPVTYATFKYREGEVIITACEASAR